MHELQLLLVAIILTAFFFDFTNGAHDSANAIATVVSTKVLSPKVAVLMAALLNFIGALLGTEVALTIGSGIINAQVVAEGQALVLAALIGAIVWNIFTWKIGLPSSSSHALIGGLVGATFVYAGVSALNLSALFYKVILPLFGSPLMGFLCGYLIMLILAWALMKVHPSKVNKAMRKLQIVSASFMATSHGLNDAQKTMGIVTLALFIFNQIPEIAVPLWVKISCAVFMALGTATGGWKIVKTMGHKIFKLEPVHGFAAETSASLIIIGASSMGFPVSTTHTISASILGVGASKRLSAVHWNIAEEMVLAWIFTIPATAILSGLIYILLSFVF